MVEFSLDSDGRVVSALPIYVTGRRGAAIAFARAVSNWSWSAEQAKAVPVFYRALTRVEMRCSTAADVPGAWKMLTDAASAWLFADTVPAWREMSDAAAVPLERAALAAGAAGSRAELAALFALAENVSLGEEERQGFADRAAALAPQLDAPAPVRAWAGMARLSSAHQSAKRRNDALRTLLANPAIGGDPLTGAVLKLMIGRPDESRRSANDAVSLLDQVIATPGLPELHPLKVNALLRKANLLAVMGDTAGAEAAFRKTGLDAEQCATLGLTPANRSSGASSGDFPKEAMHWGFEGWVMTEFDIAPDGRTAAQRAVIAYPPFVFDAAVGIARQSRWASSYRPGGSVACAASHQSVRFQMSF